MKTTLVVDGTNILNRVFHANLAMHNDVAGGLALHSAFVTLNKYFNKYCPNRMVICFDRSNWRKKYTMSGECVSPLVYKANRLEGKTPSELVKIKEFSQRVAEFEDIIRTHTKIHVLSADQLEADDLVAGMVEKFPEDRIIILSADKDFIQLLKTPNVVLIDPDKDARRICDDVNWFMFLKCFRGDKGDNVINAYPRVRETRLKKAYEDEFERLTIMDEKYTSPLGTEIRVGDLFNENKLLMDLTQQPPEIRQLIFDTIDIELARETQFSIFHFKRFCKKHDLVKISEKCADYAHMLANIN